MHSKQLVLDANILLRAIFGTHTLALIEAYYESVEFYSPDTCFEEARRNVIVLAARRRTDPARALELFDQLTQFIERIDITVYGDGEEDARLRISARDESDWPVLAAALVFRCPIWTEDHDFFGTGVPTWTTATIEHYLGDS